MTRLVQGVLGETALAGYLYGSAVTSGLKAGSDLDVLVVSARATTTDQQRELIHGLLALSGPRAAAGPGRYLEVTIVVQSDVRPWRYPPRMDLQYGDWWRAAFEREELRPWSSPNPDLAVLLTSVRADGVALFGPPPAELLDPVPSEDLQRAVRDVIPGLLSDLDDDTANVLLTLARVRLTLATGEIRSKDAAAEWMLARLPDGRGAALARARQVYLGDVPDTWSEELPAAREDAAAMLAGIEPSPT